MTYLNPTEFDYKEDNKVKPFVDKSLFINSILKLINENKKQIAYILPRRFGKTSLANMLVAYFSKGACARELFANKKIAQIPNWDENLNKHNLIYIDIQGIADSTTAENFFNYLHKKINADLIKNYPEVNIDMDQAFTENIMTIHEKTNEMFMFIIDEYDVLYRDKEFKNIISDYDKLLNKISKAGDFRKCVSLVYLTGIVLLGIGKTQSKLNNFTILSIIDNLDFEDFIGFTEDEVKVICEDYNSRESTQKSVDFEEVKLWYNGYKLKNGTSIYNPYAINKLLERTTPNLTSHWTFSSPIEILKDYILYNKQNIDDENNNILEQKQKESLNYSIYKLQANGLYEDVSIMAKKINDGEHRGRIKTEINNFIDSLTHFNSKKELYTLLIFLGYLTYDYETEECYIPNNEIAQVFYDILKLDSDYSVLFDKLELSSELLERTINLDANYVSDNFNIEYETTARKAFFKNHDALQAFIHVSYYYAGNDYDIKYENYSGRGFADVIFKPNEKASLTMKDKRPPIIFEVKYFAEKLTDERRDKEAKLAIEQMIKKKYYFEFKDYKRIILVSLIYYIDSDNEYTHHCIIEEFNP